MQGQNNWIGAPGCDEALSGMMTITSLTNEERGLESGGFRPNANNPRIVKIYTNGT